MTFNDDSNGVVAQYVDSGDSVAQTPIAPLVEAERNPLRWLWWLLGLLILGLLAWAIVRGCTRSEVDTEPLVDDTATSIIADRMNLEDTTIANLRADLTTADANLANRIDDSGFATGLRTLCAHSLTGVSHTAAEVAGFFGQNTLLDTEAANLENLVNDSWCYADRFAQTR